jgi:UDP:flavonoid glycosyltransferase YjiC (YdhE family)
MSRIAIATFGSFGDLHPYMAIALELKARGHRPVIATTDRYRDKITAAGIDFHAVRPGAELFGDERALLEKVMHSSNGPEYVIRELMLPNLRDSHADTLALAKDADLLVSHPLSYSVSIVAEQLSKPWAATALQPLMFFSIYDPPLLPKGQFLAPLYCRSSWLAAFLFWLARHAMMRGWDRPIQELRREAGLPPSKGNPFFEGQFSPYANIALFSKQLASPQRDWPANTTVTGFAFYDQQEHGRGMPAELATFLDAGPPPIVFTLGTSAVMVAGDFYRQALAAATSLDRRAVFLIGKDERNQLGKLPAGMIAAEYAPYSELFPRAAAIVHQAGAGTTGQAMRAGKPMVIVPFSHDQPDHAMRLKRLGISETVPRHACTASRLAEALRRVLNDPRYAANAARVGEEVRAENGVQLACDVLEGVIADFK